jgi:hypothetical protein
VKECNKLSTHYNLPFLKTDRENFFTSLYLHSDPEGYDSRHRTPLLKGVTELVHKNCKNEEAIPVTGSGGL